MKSVDSHSMAYIPSGRGTANARVTPHQLLRSVSVKKACITRAGGAWINCVRVTSRTFASVAIWLLVGEIFCPNFLETLALVFPHRH